MASRRSAVRAREPRPRLRKALGQHHLTSPELCRPAVEYLGLGRDEGWRGRILEIGPGGGVLTGALLDAGWEVLAVELDLAWVVELRRRLGARARTLAGSRLRVVAGDALDLRFRGLGEDWAVAGNLPYAISTAVVERVLDDAPAGTRCAFLVQKEVADRLLATPGSRTYGSLSVLVSLRTRGRRLARVRPGSFHPPPKVESAFIGLEVQDSQLEREVWMGLKQTVRAAFAQRRKTLANGLTAAFGAQRARAALESCGIEASLRAEALRPADFLGLHRSLTGP
ncbi:MAG TPA: 16S rRNA (adenine(1518)-N(6)/adenine(1519)-N(6))-dimethyltransferase RsmA [Thermoanaerobaculia bacterium]|nr:16S rRNA (adenine(1518)-N(6)/adenine(1519)-N(6))-dimethyltransferase RsmA [Thermoanaerobaculia bacterium]